MAKGLTEAKKRIAEAKRTKATELNLSLLGLTTLPPELGQLQNLQSLDLSENQLSALPEAVGQLQKLQSLDLSENQLSALPDAVGQLDNLQTLNLSYNELGTVPEAIGRLRNLQTLGLVATGLSALPDAVGQLQSLKTLGLNANRLGALPEAIGQLQNLHTLALYSNKLSVLPEAIVKLRNLQTLTLGRNRLSALPEAIGQLQNLRILGLGNNQLRALPQSIGGLPKLSIIHGSFRLASGSYHAETSFRENPLSQLPPEVVEQGDEAILEYLQGTFEEGERQWVSKLLIVGQGGVGKTSVLRALQGEGFDFEERTTRGIAIRKIELKHPGEEGVVMTLTSWDFGGQEIYHATHQFFLTSRSLFLLVWNAREDYEAGKLPYWLDTISARAPDSPVLIVATHTDERAASLPFEELKRKFPQVIDHFEVTNKPPRDGIEALRQAIATAAAKLPLMGEIWPASWKDAADAVRRMRRKHISPNELHRRFKKHNVGQKCVGIPETWLHQLGDILYFKDNRDLDDLVILKPQWVTEYLSKVLESRQVQDTENIPEEAEESRAVLEGLQMLGKHGIFTRPHMEEVWHDLDPNLQDHFLRLMEQFDLSYRTKEHDDISIVVERLSLDEADYRPQWDAKQADGCQQIQMKFELDQTMPAGIPTWFIARSHRFTTYTHWKYGALLKDDENGTHLGLVRALPDDKIIYLTVRGPSPHNFFVLLKDGLDKTFERFPGLKIKVTLPCPGHVDLPECPYEFDFAAMERAVRRTPPIRKVACQRTWEEVEVSQLLFGIHWGTQEETVRKGRETVRWEQVLGLLSAMDHRLDQNAEAVGKLTGLVQRQFLQLYRSEQEKIDSRVPNVFVLGPHVDDPEIRTLFGGASEPSWTRRLWSQVVGPRMQVQLCCQAPGQWHPALKGGRYDLADPDSWLSAMLPYLERMMKVFRVAAPLAGPVAGVVAPVVPDAFKYQFQFTKSLVAAIPEFGDRDSVRRIREEGEGSEGRLHGAELRALKSLLSKKDPEEDYGGLDKVVTPEGHHLWLCEYHANEYR